MAPKAIDGTSRRGEWGVNLLALAIVLATIVIGYGLAHPRDLPLPFGVDVDVAAAHIDRGVARPAVTPSPVAIRDDRSRAAAPVRR
jgi:hypothetical protein